MSPLAPRPEATAEVHTLYPQALVRMEGGHVRKTRIYVNGGAGAGLGGPCAKNHNLRKWVFFVNGRGGSIYEKTSCT